MTASPRAAMKSRAIPLTTFSVLRTSIASISQAGMPAATFSAGTPLLFQFRAVLKATLRASINGTERFLDLRCSIRIDPSEINRKRRVMRFGGIGDRPAGTFEGDSRQCLCDRIGFRCVGL